MTGTIFATVIGLAWLWATRRAGRKLGQPPSRLPELKKGGGRSHAP